MLNENEPLLELQELRERIEKLEKILSSHQHLGKDDSAEFEGANEFKGKTLLLSAGEKHKSGVYYLPLNVLDSNQADKKARGMAIGLAVVGQKDTSEEEINAALVTGKSCDAEKFPPIQSQFDFTEYNQAQMRLVHNPQSEVIKSGPSFLPPQSFLIGERTPLFQGTGTITQGGNTLSDSQAKFVPNSLTCSIITLSKDGDYLESYRVIGNTEKSILIGENGETWKSPGGTYTYLLTTPILLGDVLRPFARLYVGEDIRFGYGPSGGPTVTYIKFGYGSPEGVVVANRGSIYLRKDGDAGTTLYVKTADDGKATGWTAK